MKPHQKDFSKEWQIKTSRSGGPGGQNVNKVNSKVTLRFDIDSSEILHESEKTLLKEKLSNKISNDNILIITSESERSQLKNREEAISKFYRLLKKAFTVRKKRKPTKPTKAAIQKRLNEKKKLSDKKQLRQKP